MCARASPSLLFAHTPSPLFSFSPERNSRGMREEKLTLICIQRSGYAEKRKREWEEDGGREGGREMGRQREREKKK